MDILKVQMMQSCSHMFTTVLKQISFMRKHLKDFKSLTSMSNYFMTKSKSIGSFAL